MKVFKPIILFLSLMLILMSVTSCTDKPYSFQKPIEEIERIEIVFAKDCFTFEVKKTLSESEKNSFLEQFLDLSFHYRTFGDPETDVSGNAIVVTYQDDDYEIIDSTCAVYIKNGKYNKGLSRSCNTQEFDNLLSSFID